MAEELYIDPERVRVRNGKFDSDNRYLREGTFGARFPLPRSRTLDIRGQNTGPGSINGYACRYSVRGYRFTQTRWASGGDTNGGNYDADFYLAKV